MRFLIAALFLAVPLAAAEDNAKLIEASKAAKAKRKTSTSKPITNKDVKNSKGKLVVLKEKPLPAADKKADNSLSPSQEQDKRYQARLEAQDKLDAVAKKVAELEKKLEDLELKYYEDSDLNHRDEVVRKAFGETKRELEKARTDLLAATQTLESATRP